MQRRRMLFVIALLALAGCGDRAPTGQAATESVAERGARLYAIHCIACHQRDGLGRGDAQPALAGSATVAGDPAKLVAWLLFGIRPPTNRPTRSIVVMPQFAWLDDDDVAAVLTHVRASFGNSQPAVTAEEVAAVRAAGPGK
jgi:mono/diheme cytochrome c family protein